MDDISYTYVDTPEALEKLCAHLKDQASVAIDSEADNLYHYETRLCLIQLRFEGTTYLLDVLADLDLQPFWALLADKLLIMHGSDFDLRLFQDFSGFRAGRIFDSMLAAQLLGIKRIGLAALLEEFFELKLPKDSQKSDWSRRPLTEKMLTYAANDVQYLFQLHDILMGRIRELGREEWLGQRCDYQIEVASTGFPQPDENAWRISKSDRLDDAAKAALFELWHWREALARKLDRPPFKVLGNDYLLTLAEAVSEGNWKYVLESMPPGIRRRKRQGLEDALKRGSRLDPKALPRRPFRGERKAPLTQEELARQENIKNFRNALAEKLDIDPTFLATRSQVAQLARDPEDFDGFLPWQREMLEPSVLRAAADADEEAEVV